MPPSDRPVFLERNAMPKQVEISPQVRDVLQRGAWAEGGTYHLPEGHLERPLYEACDKVLRALGGKWDRKVRGHRFAADKRQALEDALTDGVAVDQKRTLEQFFTPPEIADQVVALAQIEPEQTVLEPSAGAGALIAAVAKAHPTAIITAVELDTDLYRALHAEWGLRATIIAADFLAMPTGDFRPDRIVMNPPFGRGADMAHVSRALTILRPGGVLVSVMSPHWTFAKDAASERFRGLVNGHSHEWTPLPEGSFRASDTGVNTGLLTIRKGTI